MMMENEVDNAAVISSSPHHSPIQSTTATIAVVRKGWLMKRSDYVHSWRRRYCVLTATPPLLTYYRDVGDKKPRATIVLSGRVIRSLPKTQKREAECPFGIFLPNDKLVCRLATRSQLDTDGWIKALTAVVSGTVGTNTVVPTTGSDAAAAKNRVIMTVDDGETPLEQVERQIISSAKRDEELENGDDDGLSILATTNPNDSDRTFMVRDWGGVRNGDIRAMVLKPYNELLDRSENARGWRVKAVESSIRVCQPISRALGAHDDDNHDSMWTAITTAFTSSLIGNTDALQLKGSCIVSAPATLVFRLLLNMGRREQWDVLFESGSIIESISIELRSAYRSTQPSPKAASSLYRRSSDSKNCGADVVQMTWRPLWDSQWGRVWTSSRDFVYLRVWSMLEEKTADEYRFTPLQAPFRSAAYCISTRSVEHRLCPNTSGGAVVRGTLVGGGWVIRPIPDDTNSRCMVTYIADLRVGGWFDRMLSTSSQANVLQSRLMSRLSGVADYAKHMFLSDPRLDRQLASLVAQDRSMSSPLVQKTHAADTHIPTIDISHLLVPNTDESTMYGGKGVVRGKSGGLIFTDKEQISRQKGVATDLIKSMGMNILVGKNPISISLPVRIFEPRSFLQRMSDIWCFASIFLAKAGQTRDPIERMKLTVTFMIAGLHRGCKQVKPFNPILGETYQGVMPDGSGVFCEQISHHPPVSAFEVCGPQNVYKLHGHHEYCAAFKANGLLGKQLGPNTIEFLDGARISYNMPFLLVSGLIFGERTMHWTGTVKFCDHKNRLGCDVHFNPDKSVFQRSPVDRIRGEMYTFSGSGGGGSDGESGGGGGGGRSSGRRRRRGLSQRNATNEPSGKRVLCTVTGSWLTELKFDDDIYWNVRMYKPCPAVSVPEKQRLPSDCTKREDLMLLADGDLDASQAKKEWMEDEQRRLKKLRKKYYPN